MKCSFLWIIANLLAEYFRNPPSPQCFLPLKYRSSESKTLHKTSIWHIKNVHIGNICGTSPAVFQNVVRRLSQSKTEYPLNTVWIFMTGKLSELTMQLHKTSHDTCMIHDSSPNDHHNPPSCILQTPFSFWWEGKLEGCAELPNIPIRSTLLAAIHLMSRSGLRISVHQFPKGDPHGNLTQGKADLGVMRDLVQGSK